MSDLEHRVGVSEANLVLRHLKLTNIDDAKISAIIRDTDAAFGVDAVSFDLNKQTLHIGYDVTHCDLDGIENIVKINGGDISHDWWTDFKEGYYQFVDENIRENAKHKPWSCYVCHRVAEKNLSLGLMMVEWTSDNTDAPSFYRFV